MYFAIFLVKLVSSDKAHIELTRLIDYRSADFMYTGKIIFLSGDS